jgi:hypothetical protein
MAIKNGNVIQAKTGTATYTVATATAQFTLPSGAQIVGVRCFGTASDDTGTATLTFKTIPQGSSTATTFAIVDVKTALSAVTGLFAVSSYAGAAFTKLTTPTTVTTTYAGQNTNAAAGSFTFIVEYL